VTTRRFERRGVAAAWTSANPVLGPAEIGVEVDTLKVKVGDGVTAWASLAYLVGSGGSFAALTDVNLAGLADTNAMVWDAATSKWIAASVVAANQVFAQAQPINAQTGTTYTLVAGDAGKLVTCSNAAAITLSVPQDSAATIAVGVYIDLYQLGAGQVTVAAGTGATLRVSGLTAKARAQYSRLVVQKVSANTWLLAGDLAGS
jgi:hypothetical protein